MEKATGLPFKRERIFSLDEADFEDTALKVFRFQYAENEVYQSFVRYIGVNPDDVKALDQIPFLPVKLFKERIVISGDFQPEKVFESSTTTGDKPSKHYVRSLDWYAAVFTHVFQQFYGTPADYTILALLPGYLERKNASLVYMADGLIKQSGKSESGFYLDDFEKLHRQLILLEKQQQKTILVGVSFALLDFADQFKPQLKNTIVMETGGMKGRRKELWRAEFHEILKKSFHLKSVHSEYGMTELMSQAYSKGEGKFSFPSWCRALKRDSYDPFEVTQSPGRGLLNIVDLANLDSCSFLAVDDVVELLPDNQFLILGRMQSSDVRGCNLMVM